MSSRGAAAGQILLLGHIPCRHSPSLWHNLPYSWFCREIILEGRSGPRWPQAELFLHPSSKCCGCNTSPLGCLGAFEGKHRIHRSLQSDTVPQLRLGSVEGLGWLHLTHPKTTSPPDKEELQPQFSLDSPEGLSGFASWCQPGTKSQLPPIFSEGRAFWERVWVSRSL